jgi:hypothetical protein
LTTWGPLSTFPPERQAEGAAQMTRTEGAAKEDAA